MQHQHAVEAYILSVLQPAIISLFWLCPDKHEDTLSVDSSQFP